MQDNQQTTHSIKKSAGISDANPESLLKSEPLMGYNNQRERYKERHAGTEEQSSPLLSPLLNPLSYKERYAGTREESLPELTLQPNYDEIDITDDYMFTTVMQDPLLCMELLEYLLPDIRISKLKYIRFNEDGTEAARADAGTEIQKTMPGYFGFRGVRLDAYVDDGKTIYNIELQATEDKALPRRSRLYQSHIDISQLRRGENYDQLRPCFVIFICKYDPFGKGFCRYSFHNTCDEDQGLALNDGAYKLFFNTAGHIGEIPPGLKELLAYMRHIPWSRATMT